MRVCRPEFIKKVVALVSQRGILVIFDEIMTGFGRTGSYFAFEQLDITPDFLCLSKGITGGFVPLALTITSKQLYEVFMGDDFYKAFAHGHSYTANPLACSAAITSLTLLKNDECQSAIKNLNIMYQEGISALKLECAIIEKPRIIGTIAAFDIKNSACCSMSSLTQSFLEQGILLRPLGNTVYLLPPYCIKHHEMTLAYDKIISIINSI